MADSVWTLMRPVPTSDALNQVNRSCSAQRPSQAKSTVEYPSPGMSFVPPPLKNVLPSFQFPGGGSERENSMAACWKGSTAVEQMVSFDEVKQDLGNS
jgi:hypothetical protein